MLARENTLNMPTALSWLLIYLRPDCSSAREALSLAGALKAEELNCMAVFQANDRRYVSSAGFILYLRSKFTHRIRKIMSSLILFALSSIWDEQRA